ncbi:MAG: transposase, partial [Burkholderia sp.]
VNEVARRKNRNKSRIRARVEHVFAVVKRRWGFTKVCYHGLAKNSNPNPDPEPRRDRARASNRAFVALATANVYLCRARLMAQVRP